MECITKWTEAQIRLAKSIQRDRVEEFQKRMEAQYGPNEYRWPEDCCEALCRLRRLHSDTDTAWFIETKDLGLFEMLGW